MLAKTELFHVRMRALAVGLPYALTTAILGGTTEFVALKFKSIGHEHYFYLWLPTAAKRATRSAARSSPSRLTSSSMRTLTKSPLIGATGSCSHQAPRRGSTSMQGQPSRLLSEIPCVAQLLAPDSP
jgi:hypothetical protein